MNHQFSPEEMITEFEEWLKSEEKSLATIGKYKRDLNTFASFLGEYDKEAQKKSIFSINKDSVLAYKSWLLERYSIRSANSMLTALNTFFRFKEWHEYQVKAYKLQNELFRLEEKELSKEEYFRMLDAARRAGDKKMYYLLQTLCSTGIRVSELSYITVEAIREGRAKVYLKGKFREILLPTDLCQELQYYAAKEGIKSGKIFLTRYGNDLDRSNILKAMKRVARLAGVPESKAFPHNLRHLFAVTYYAQEKDVCRLADILGHSNVNTTRIYTLLSTSEHMKQMDQLGLIYHTTT